LSSGPGYNKVTHEIVAELGRIVGERYVLYGDPEKLAAFSHDETPDDSYARMPEVVVRPESAEEIAQIMKLANRERIPVTPRGAGSGLSGGAVPVFGGIVLFTDRMNRVIEIDTENMMIVVEPGVVTNEINAMLKEHGLVYPGYPMSLETCFIGGNVAENAGGGKAVKYGVTGRYVIGLEVVTPTGEIIQLGGKLIKNVTGYDLIGLMVGSEGTLGVFTKITLRLMPLQRASADLLCLYKTSEEAIRAVPRIMTESGVTPAAMEFMDRNAVRAACDYLNEKLDYREAGAMLLVSVDGTNMESVRNDYDRVGEVALKTGAIEVYVADNTTTSQRVWRIRRNVAEAFNAISRHQSNEDLVVPPARIPELVAGLVELGRKYGVVVCAYGHAADGNIHARIDMDPSWEMSRWKETLPRVLKELYDLTVSLGGMLTGEHGVGHKRSKHLGTFLSQEHIALLRTIKDALDPNHILNPGKIFPS